MSPALSIIAKMAQLCSPRRTKDATNTPVNESSVIFRRSLLLAIYTMGIYLPALYPYTIPQTHQVHRCRPFLSLCHPSLSIPVSLRPHHLHARILTHHDPQHLQTVQRVEGRDPLDRVNSLIVLNPEDSTFTRQSGLVPRLLR